jgi:hypothetical protein
LAVEDVLLEGEAFEEEAVLEHHQAETEVVPDFAVGYVGVGDVSHVEFEEVGEGVKGLFDSAH